MKAHVSQFLSALLVLSVLIPASYVQADAAKTKNGKDPVPSTNSVPAVAEQEIPQSVFLIPVTPKDGRNPFFPESAQIVPQITKPKGDQFGDQAFVLNGMTPSGPRRTAMINGRTFEIGESGEVRLPSGTKLLIKCEEIKVDSVIISVDGQRREIRMRFGL